MNSSQKINVMLIFILMVVFTFSQILIASGQVLEDKIYLESNGFLKVEAEHFYKQTKSDLRQWYIVSSDFKTTLKENDPAIHVEGASGGAYVEILPDTRTNHSEKLIAGENFSNKPGEMAILHYKIRVTTPGRYYIWVRAYSTGSEDNGIHVGLDGTWPASGARMQWCPGKNSWYWDSKQRTQEVHCGVPGLIYLDIDSAGEHEIQFSMREDGFEMDQWLMTTLPDYDPTAD
jgi:hypothetical protein